VFFLNYAVQEAGIDLLVEEEKEHAWRHMALWKVQISRSVQKY
jgi:hypothetical protein